VTAHEPILLAVEASTRAPSCAVLAGGRVFERTAPAKPVEDLAGLIARTLADAGIALAEVGQLVVGVGPGSYMGVRAAVSTANALSFAAGLPLAGVVSTDALAVLAPAGRDAITVGVHAGRGRVFVARYARRDGRLERDALPVLLGEEEWLAQRAGVVIADDGMPPAGDAPAEHQRRPLLASGVLRVYTEQPHLLVASEPAGAVPILPPATIGAAR
jgi:tRNA threonylcarbamoyl adenosine modification protein YeaZ